jgi:hypothetical protein
MSSDTVFFGTILAMFALMCRHPVVAFFIFAFAVL